jgi:3-oxoacyl-[acyl-carrier protein] reductase
MNKRKVLVTGASRGIGRAIVEVLKKTNEYNILTPSRDELELTNSDSIDNFVIRNNDIDILINNAGINIVNYIQDIKDTDIESMFLTNIIAPIKLIRGIVPHMMEKNYGRIVNISSIWGITSKEKRSIYSATKFGINGITKTLARELGKYNILVDSICPGYVNTEMTKKNVTEIEKKEILKNIPLNRFAEPIEIGYLVKFLISDENTYITGQSIIIDGGFMA